DMCRYRPEGSNWLPGPLSFFLVASMVEGLSNWKESIFIRTALSTPCSCFASRINSIKIVACNRFCAYVYSPAHIALVICHFEVSCIFAFFTNREIVLSKVSFRVPQAAKDSYVAFVNEIVL